MRIKSLMQAMILAFVLSPCPSHCADIYYNFSLSPQLTYRVNIWVEKSLSQDIPDVHKFADMLSSNSPGCRCTVNLRLADIVQDENDPDQSNFRLRLGIEDFASSTTLIPIPFFLDSISKHEYEVIVTNRGQVISVAPSGARRSRRLPDKSRLTESEKKTALFASYLIPDIRPGQNPSPVPQGTLEDAVADIPLARSVTRCAVTHLLFVPPQKPDPLGTLVSYYRFQNLCLGQVPLFVREELSAEAFISRKLGCFTKDRKIVRITKSGLANEDRLLLMETVLLPTTKTPKN